MKLTIFAFGQLKTPGLRQAADYYQRLIRSWNPIVEIELKALSIPQKDSATRTRIQDKEGQILLHRIQTKSTLRGTFSLLDETGPHRSTLDWAQELRDWERLGTPVSLCIGSSLGFSKEVRRQAKGTFSLGPQTLSHELARVVLYEQLYRASSVTHRHPYHNEGS